MQMTPLYSSLGKSGGFWEGETAGEVEFGLCSIVEWSGRLLVTFNATKTKLLSFNRHRDPRLVPVEMNGIELPEETSFYLLGLTFYSIYGPETIYTVHCQGCFKGSGSLLNHPSCICTNLPFGYVWSTVPLSGVVLPRSHGLDLLDRTEKRVVSLVGSGLSSDL